MSLKSIIAASAVSILMATAAQASENLRIVGSSTVFPFTTTVAETFSKKTNFRAPVVESTGTGGGMKLFCGGVGVEHPDMTNASRAIKASEVELCAANGVNQIIELRVGFDGIVLANDKNSPTMDLTKQQLFQALAMNLPTGTDDGEVVWSANNNVTWNDVDSGLPNTRIEVLGPPPTSGTRDAFVELAMEAGCKAMLKSLDVKYDKKKHKSNCHSMRQDGHFIEAGENDNLIIQKLTANPQAYGIFGFSFLDQNADKVQGSKISGVEPTFEAIADGSYPVSRSLFVYIKGEHLNVRPGMKEFVAEYISEAASGESGYLTDRGLIPLPQQEHQSQRDKIGQELK